MANFFADNDDLKYYFEKRIDWKAVVDLMERDYKGEDAPADWREAASTYEDVLNLFGEFGAEAIAPHAEAMDRFGTKLVDGKVEMSPVIKFAASATLYPSSKAALGPIASTFAK